MPDNYRVYMTRGLKQGRRPELTGGGLVRSAGGWEAVKVLRKKNVYQNGDDRILGDGDSVEGVLAGAKTSLEYKYAVRAAGFDIEKIEGG